MLAKCGSLNMDLRDDLKKKDQLITCQSNGLGMPCSFSSIWHAKQQTVQQCLGSKASVYLKSVGQICLKSLAFSMFHWWKVLGGESQRILNLCPEDCDLQNKCKQKKKRRISIVSSFSITGCWSDSVLCLFALSQLRVPFYAFHSTPVCHWCLR